VRESCHSNALDLRVAPQKLHHPLCEIKLQICRRQSIFCVRRSDWQKMANVQSTQAFYSLTLEPSSAPTAAVTCNAIPGLKNQDQQIFEARGQRIYLSRIIENDDRTEVKVSTVLDQDVFGIVRGVAAFRIPGTATGTFTLSAGSLSCSDRACAQHPDLERRREVVYHGSRTREARASHRVVVIIVQG